MKDYRFKSFDDDVEIWGIGSLFRWISKNKWNVGLHLTPTQRRNYLSLSNAPILARKRRINPSPEFQRRGYKQRVRISDTSEWAVKTIGDCPIKGFARRPDAGQLCFVFENYDGRIIFLPQFELARILFFHGTYLSRTAIESDCLRSEFDVAVDNVHNTATIRVMPSASYTVSHFNEPGTQNYLSWLLLDKNARKSYESICKYQRLYGVDTPKYRRWTFQFDPPPLTDVFMQTRGWYVKDANCVFLWEIDEIKNIPNGMPEEVYIEHPKFERSVPGSGQGIHPAGNGEESPLVIHDDVVSNANTTSVVMAAESVAVVFKNAFHVNRVASKERKTPTSSVGKETDGTLVSVSTEEGAVDRGLPAADWNTLKDETDYSQFYENKFDCFLDMVRVLIGSYKCIPVSKSIAPLPKVGRCKKHLLSNGKPRCIAVIELRTGGKTVLLLEVDTSDADKALSTQVLAVNDLARWEASIEQVKQKLVQSSLRWPTDLLDEICGRQRHKGVNHPQAPKGNSGVLDPESVAGWGGRICGWMQML